MFDSSQILYSLLLAIFAICSKTIYNITVFKLIIAIVGLLSIFVIRRTENGNLLWSLDTSVYALGWFVLEICVKSNRRIGFNLLDTERFYPLVWC